MTFVGTVKLRSSVTPASERSQNPPGEAEVFAKNPQRAKRICSLTGWSRVEPGTLNLTVSKEVFDAMVGLTPLWVEDGATITYPPRFAHIPRQRGPYLYFRAEAKVGDRSGDVLVRRPSHPISTTIELYAPVKLMESLAVRDADQVTVEMHAT
jgi:CTP-dependent riboflavin kinase